MTSDSESVKDKTVQNFTETPCGICGYSSTCDERMVGCDGCSAWFHIRCVGVNEGNMPKRWYCQNIACHHKAQEFHKQKKQSRNRKQTNESDKPSINSRLGASSVEAKVKALEERQKRRMEEMEVEMQLMKKEKVLQRTYEMKLMELELQIRAEEEEEELAWQEEVLRTRTDQIERMKANQKSFEKQMAAMEKQIAILSDVKMPMPESEPKADVLRAEPSIKIIRNALKPTKDNVEKFVEDYVCTEQDTDGDKYSKTSESSKEKKSKNNASQRTGKKVDNVSQDGLSRQQTGPTRAQLTARKGLTYKLPKFSGNPAQWPLFYAAYKASNDACGYMNHENLMRLQDSLVGDALELVSGQLLLPQTIPRVIEKLRRHYGRPEQLLESLLDKVNQLDPPQPDNLGSFVPFGNTVEQLCDHLEAAELQQHLVNPLLINSLVAKLPDREKREWVHYRRGRGETTLRTLTDFLMGIVTDACEANVDVNFKRPNEFPRISQPGRNMSKENGAVYFHSAISSASADTKGKIPKPCNQCRRTDHRLRHCAGFKKMQYADRLKRVIRERLCHACLNEHGGKRKLKIRCNIGECMELHNPLIHPVENVVDRSAHIQTNCMVHFRIVPVQLRCGEKSATVLAFLDEGSSVTLVEKKLADRLGAVGVQEQLSIRWTGNVSRVEDTRRMSLWASGTSANADDKMLLHTVHTVDKLMLPHQAMDFMELAAQYIHMRGLPIESYDGQPQLLIGVNNIHAFVPMEARVGNPMEPIAVRTNLGWTVYGPRQSTTVAASNYLGYHQQVADENWQELIKNQYALEKSVVAVLQEPAEDKRVGEILERSTKREGDRFETGLQRKMDDPETLDRYPMVQPSMKQPKYEGDYAVEKAAQQVQEIQIVHWEVGFEDRNWASDSSEDSRCLGVKKSVGKKYVASSNPLGLLQPLTIKDICPSIWNWRLDWRWILAKIDIVDVWTMWNTSPPLQNDEGGWFNGSSLLNGSQEMWPTQKFEEAMLRAKSSEMSFVTNDRRKKKSVSTLFVKKRRVNEAQWNRSFNEIGSFRSKLKQRPSRPAAMIRSRPIYKDPTADGKNRKSWKRGTIEASIQDYDDQVQKAAVWTDDEKALIRGGEFCGDKGKVNPEMPDVTGGSVTKRFEQAYVVNRSNPGA